MDFDSILGQSIDEAMNVLGDPGKQVVYLYLDRSFSLKKEEMVTRVEELTIYWEKMFGIGTNFLYDLILRIVSHKLSMDYGLFDLNNNSFLTCISIARSIPQLKGS